MISLHTVIRWCTVYPLYYILSPNLNSTPCLLFSSRFRMLNLRWMLWVIWGCCEPATPQLSPTIHALLVPGRLTPQRLAPGKPSRALLHTHRWKVTPPCGSMPGWRSQWRLVLLNLLTCGLEICVAAGITYVPPLLLEAGVEEKYMTMVLGEASFVDFSFALELNWLTMLKLIQLILFWN